MTGDCNLDHQATGYPFLTLRLRHVLGETMQASCYFSNPHPLMSSSIGGPVATIVLKYSGGDFPSPLLPPCSVSEILL